MVDLRVAVTVAVALLISACSSDTPASTPASGGSSGSGTSGTTTTATTSAASGATGGSAGASVGASTSVGSGGTDADTSGAGGNAGDDGGVDGRIEGATAGGSNEDAKADGAAMGGWPPVDDYGAHGPLATQRDNNTGPGAVYDVFRPTTLGPAPRKHPIVSWANGTLFGVDGYQKLLDHWASHGFVVIAAHSQSTAGGATHKAGIDWLVAESARSSSPYFGLLDTTAIGAA